MEEQAVSYRSVNENPCHMCMPIGAILPFKGVERSMVLIHGSQGCSTYMRRHISEHFNEPVDVGSSSLNEKGTVYGGEANLKQGLDNLIKIYHPSLIGVLTTCLAETIGEDIDRIGQEYLRERKMDNFPLVTVPTPGYGHSHSEGFSLAVKRILARLARKSPSHGRINVLVPNISPADLREIKRLLEIMGVRYTLLPDFSETLDAPFTSPYHKIPSGGTGLNSIREMPGAIATLQMGVTLEEGFSPGKYLEEEYRVPLFNLPLPIGLENTDTFIRSLQKVTGAPVPEILLKERGRLLDAMVDAHKYNFAGRCIIFGEPELVYAMAGTCLENGVTPVAVATGGKGAKLKTLLQTLRDRYAADAPDTGNGKGVGPVFLPEADFDIMRRTARERGANLAIGHSGGKYLTEKEGIPLVRMGFPIHDRVGGQRIFSAGYAGTTVFLDRITNTLLERKLSGYRERIYRQFYRGKKYDLV